MLRWDLHPLEPSYLASESHAPAAIIWLIKVIVKSVGNERDHQLMSYALKYQLQLKSQLYGIKTAHVQTGRAKLKAPSHHNPL
ncbi:hypothetical protein PCANC_12920 [Puccinia coronata f. sp. avenae]|uniref:Uncharacterized protein n=1 Tax=Puccinia coronata f. sp. avenae TaxID=200324 RepID=A0A2N5SCF2_9BASI|nr:hypothetical protein PCANC_19122 [Puccinia coronata f. sp. avenae]PLW14331.1 hypothetical protein PCASD_18040 [Puccinia coronata f. sp. avenae]PLW28341.1 hypothetical protein PCASD_17458 [Puccinia coronata f. sp. avenae]PLW39217.1 hypothetical protein PCANC_12920 [Puccinia coronata f. sp. avenae]